ncbi:MAG TPA: DUF4395 domain-containing protein [Jatrophihabitans sp.]|nr:DUF4395 domain-containing protein [Jatrophihabitans sp.]
MPRLFEFPNPVNEKAARTVAAGVLLLALIALLPGLAWLSIVLAIGFWLRVAAGPRFSPLGQLATRVVAPRLGRPKLVAGPPKRFAQLIGASLTTVAAACFLAGAVGATQLLLAPLIVAAGLESGLGLCLGCVIFGYLMRVGLIPTGICLECSTVGLRYRENV